MHLALLGRVIFWRLEEEEERVDFDSVDVAVVVGGRVEQMGRLHLLCEGWATNKLSLPVPWLDWVWRRRYALTIV